MLREERRQTAEEIRKAAADKDVRENAPLEAARERQGHIDSRVRELERVLRSATPTGVPTAPAPTNRVAQGRRVVVRHIVSGVERSYMLVAPPEANPMNGRLSTTSPVGKALLNCVVGDEVSVPTPRGAETFRIVEIA